MKQSILPHLIYGILSSHLYNHLSPRSLLNCLVYLSVLLPVLLCFNAMSISGRTNPSSFFFSFKLNVFKCTLEVNLFQAYLWGWFLPFLIQKKSRDSFKPVFQTNKQTLSFVYKDIVANPTLLGPALQAVFAVVPLCACHSFSLAHLRTELTLYTFQRADWGADGERALLLGPYHRFITVILHKS